MQVRKKSRKTRNESHVGKITLIYMDKMKTKQARSVYRWIVQKRNDGRFLARAPKKGVLVRDLKKKRSIDFGPVKLLPADFIFVNHRNTYRKPKRKTSRKPKRKTSRKPKRKTSRKPKRKTSRKPKRKTSRKPKRKTSRKPKRKTSRKPKRKTSRK